MQKNLLTRHAYQAIRRALDRENFIEVETADPDQNPSRRGAGLSSAEPRESGRILCASQSPQLFKQILDGVGARPLFSDREVFPGRGLKADRQPEFTNWTWNVFH